VRVVPRSWSIVWAEMTGRSLPAELPGQWTAQWSAVAQQQGFWPIPHAPLDETETWPASPRRDDIARANRAQADALRAVL
jgi:acetoin utilization protein AcuC